MNDRNLAAMLPLHQLVCDSERLVCANGGQRPGRQLRDGAAIHFVPNHYPAGCSGCAALSASDSIPSNWPLRENQKSDRLGAKDAQLTMAAPGDAGWRALLRTIRKPAIPSTQPKREHERHKPTGRKPLVELLACDFQVLRDGLQ
jgi:hypothetical protein